MTTPAANFSITLPPDYRRQDVLAFHGRDTEATAERVEPARIRKGMTVDGVAVVLDIALSQFQAVCHAYADGALPAGASARLLGAARGILGLHIDPAPFAALAAADALFGPAVRKQTGLRIVQSGTVFEALTWAIIGQQINLSFAIALRRTFILQAGRQHSSGLWCYPEAADVAPMALEQLCKRKFSRAKAETLLRVARLVDGGQLALAGQGEIADVSQALLAIKGIGPWTVNYTLLRGYGYADCALHGDVAVQAALQHLLGEPVKPDIARTEAILAQYQPYRSMAAAHLWASLHPRSEA
ncbi:MAG: DNA-3-methyladenine glycosylase 2 [Oxalobacteraceae bacterium]|nr:DNA-3-methyladenine glycosylase 2 [Oxalobacteraceae bacterium]